MSDFQNEESDAQKNQTHQNNGAIELAIVFISSILCAIFGFR